MLIRLDSNREWDLGSLQLRSGFHQQKFPGLWIPQAQIFRITESGFPYVSINSNSRLSLSGTPFLDRDPLILYT